MPGSDSLLPFVDLNKAAIGLDLGLIEANAFGARPATHGNQNFLGFFDNLLAIGGGVGHLHARLGLLDLLELGPDVAVDAALAEDAGELLADIFVFDRNQSRQIFDDGDLAAKAR